MAEEKWQLSSQPQMLGGRTMASYIGKSHVPKPTGEGLDLPLATGSTAYEMDTGEVFMWYEHSQAWEIQE